MSDANWDGSGGRVLFVPVSGPRGMGEYARALALATAASRRWPALQIHFAVSRAAPYAADTPFPVTLLPSSPTFNTPQMRELIATFCPTLVVFDNAGRSAQLSAAARHGARVVYVSSRRRQRRKAFRLSWMRKLDEHWIAYPEFIAGALGLIERLKLRLLGRPQVRFLDVVLPPADPEVAAAMLAKLGVQPDAFVLVVPGGGTDHPGAVNAPQVVAAAARNIAEQGHPTVLVGVQPAEGTRSGDALRTLPRIPMTQLAELIRNARLVVSNGGDTLLQAIACRRACVAVPIAGDQAHRIEKCEQAGLAKGARLDAADLAEAAASLMNDVAAHDALLTRLQSARMHNGLDTALASFERLASPRQAHGPGAQPTSRAQA